MSNNDNCEQLHNNPVLPLPTSMTPQQRRSVEDSTTILVQQIRKTLNKLGQLWDQVHMDTPSREIRVQQAYDYVHNLLRDIVSSEEQMIRSIGTDLEARRKAISDLRKLFNQPHFDESSYPSGSIALLRALDVEMNRLAKKREEAMGKQLSLHEKYELYCKRTGTDPRHFDGIHDRIMTDDEVQHLQDKFTELKLLFSKRLERALELQSESKKLYESLQIPTNSSIGEDQLQCLNVDLQNHGTVLSQELMHNMTILNQRLKDYYDSWIEQVAFRYDELLVKLDELAAKCFRPPVSKEYPSNLDPKRLTGQKLQKMEEELAARQEIYERAQPVFDKLGEWMESWKQKLDAERRVCRASFYKNRAGSLNTKLKQRKLIEQKVPKLFDELQILCADYAEQNPVYDILVEGLRPDKYAESVMRGYEQDKEVQKAQKQFVTPAKRQALTPSRLATPTSTSSRRNVFTSITPSARTVRVLHPYNKQAPATVATGRGSNRKRSFSAGELSAIYPLKAPAVNGLCTSSPNTNSDSASSEWR